MSKSPGLGAALPMALLRGGFQRTPTKSELEHRYGMRLADQLGKRRATVHDASSGGNREKVGTHIMCSRNVGSDMLGRASCRPRRMICPGRMKQRKKCK